MRWRDRTILAAVIAVVMLSLVGGVEAGSHDDAYAAYNRGDYATATRLWRPFAEQGVVQAQYNLGLMYYEGRGVPQDYVTAHKWFNLSTSRFPPGDNRDKAVKNRDIVARYMTASQIAEAQRLARTWQPK